MRKEIKLRFGKKDDVLKLWWNAVSKTDDNISHTIRNALDIYRLTGQYPNLATIKVSENTEESDMLRRFSIQEEADTYLWLLDRQSKGEKVSSSVKRILRNSIRVGDSTVLTSLDELIRQAELAGKDVVIKPIVETPKEEITTSKKPELSASTETESTTDDVSPERTKGFEFKSKNEPDLFEKMLGANTLQL